MTPAELDRAVLVAALNVGLGRRYGHTGDDTTDCVRFTSAVLAEVFPDAVDARVKTDLLISHGDRARPWSPIDAAVRVGIATPVDAPRAGCWHLVQGWRRLAGGAIPATDGRANGHSVLWYGVETGGAGYLMEATNATPDWYRAEAWPQWSSRFTATAAEGGAVKLARLCPA